ncbi:Retrovirus-related Pol polyprotein from transposon TNT 1-94 [Cucumis melo var. makuwa]|uniref:Retrovirus-related Pol polyprotein from transposon TNT 1-94 n=1 Tax=Cucumis melo var. makuwa TaxID=1194695 RepID=A0A5D3E559_CUCMM|nr:Retrovirus-related Pol polyprotein from transposon TNT 1-94 [Cucumis melo var. makuwa]TYK30730.1 Retrovirus-related Pol polyprotein from transposon TNT 1-94 [Cucumis melo var. makuwa]
MRVDSSTVPMKVPKADAQRDSANINSKTISKEVIADNSKFVPSAHVRKNHTSSSIIGYTQVEGVDFDETFTPVARLEAICLLLGISCIQRFKLYQMDVKSAFLNGYLNEEVYVAQPKGFIDSEYPQHVYKLNKALYGLKQAPRAWLCARYQANSRTSHLEAIKRVLKYALLVIGKAPYEVVSFLGIILSHGSAEVSTKLPESVPKTIDSPNPASLGAHAPSVPETLLSDMDSDDLDDIPLARFLKKTSVPDVAVEMLIAPSMFVHSQESLSTEGITTPSEPNIAHASVPGDDSVAPEGRTDVHNDANQLDPPNPDVHSKEFPATTDNNPTALSASHEFLDESQPAKRKS